MNSEQSEETNLVQKSFFEQSEKNFTEMPSANLRITLHVLKTGNRVQYLEKVG